MNLKLGSVVTVLAWSLFMGITAISIGVGAIFPPLNYIAGPFVCPGGRMTTESQGYTVSPVESVTTITWYCIDNKTGEQTELNIFPISLMAGLMYGFILFLVILAVMLYRAQRAAQTQDGAQAGGDDRPPPAARAEMRYPFSDDSSATEAKLDELKELRDANQISDAVYQKRRQEILSKTPRRGE